MRILQALWFEVTDGSLLRSIEQSAIALLSNFTRGAMGIDTPSKGWLGRVSDGREVSRSGLWNDDFVKQLPPTDFGWIDELEKLL